MTHKIFNLASYDVPQEIRDRINAMTSKEQVIEYMQSVKPPSACKPGDPDLEVYWACQSALSSIKTPPQLYDVTDHQVAVSDWVLSEEYDEE
jgi:hypothetical protein